MIKGCLTIAYKIASSERACLMAVSTFRFSFISQLGRSPDHMAQDSIHHSFKFRRAFIYKLCRPYFIRESAQIQVHPTPQRPSKISTTQTQTD